MSAGDELKSKSAEMMKKVLTVGVGAVFLTEEALRTLVADWKLPKELITAILESSRKTKNEFMETLSRDVFAKVGEKIDPAALLQELVSRNEIELNIKINFKPKK
jgi:hypothetical protein